MEARTSSSATRARTTSGPRPPLSLVRGSDDDRLLAREVDGELGLAVGAHGVAGGLAQLDLGRSVRVVVVPAVAAGARLVVAELGRLGAALVADDHRRLVEVHTALRGRDGDRARDGRLTDLIDRLAER